MSKTQNTKTAKPKVVIVTEVTTAIPVGRDQYVIKNTSDGRGVSVSNKNGNLFIPFGDEAIAIVEVLTKQVADGSGRKRRRTAAEIKALQG